MWLVVVAISLFGTPLVVHADKTVVRIAHKYDELNVWHRAFEAVEKAFEARYPDIDVQVEAGWSEDKFKVGVVAGNAPDVYVVGDIPSWGVGGFLLPLNELAEAHGVRRDEFVPAAWDQNVWNGTLYALPIQIDPNFGLVWNKTLFAEVGLDPELPPQTVQEFDEYFRILTKIGPDGIAMSIGMVNWVLPGGHHNTIYTWGWLFGGEFYDYDAGKATAHHPGVLQALEYLTQYWEQYEPVRASVSRDIPPGLNRFTAGREGMIFAVPASAFNMAQQFPDLNIGITKMFNNPEAGVENATWVGGWSIGLSSASDHPEAAFLLMQFLTADPEGVQVYAEFGNWMPANIAVPYFRELGRQPDWQPFADIIVSTTRYRPAIPAIATYNAELRAVFPALLRREVTAIGAMEEISKIVDAEVARLTGL